MSSTVTYESSFTKEQLEAINSPAVGTLIVKGDFSTGKSTVLVGRAARISEEGSVCIIVSNRNSKEYLLEKLDNHGKHKAVDSDDYNCKAKILTLHEFIKTSSLFSSPTSVLLDDALLNVVQDLATTQGFSYSGLSSELVTAISDAFKGKHTSLADALSCSNDEAIHLLERFKQSLKEQSLLPLSLMDSMLLWSLESNSLKVWDHLCIDDTQDFSSEILSFLARVASKSITLCTRTTLHGLVSSLKPVSEISLHQQFVGTIAEVGVAKNTLETLSLFSTLTGIAAAGASVATTGAIAGTAGAVVGTLGAGLFPFGLIAAAICGANGGAAALAKKHCVEEVVIENAQSTKWFNPVLWWGRSTLGILAMTRAYCFEIEQKTEALADSVFGLSPGQIDVQVMTLHSSKGITFDYVILVLHTEPPEASLAKAMLHIGTTRARVNGITKIICEGEAGRKWLPYIENAGLGAHI